ncbi:U-box domain-containing protein 20 [Linum perenne]
MTANLDSTKKKNQIHHSQSRISNQDHQQEEEEEVVVPTHFLCPISLDLMTDPVTLSSGISYDRDSIETWLKGGNFTCPVTNQNLLTFDLVPNHSLRRMIQDWCVQNFRFGVERIPTPRVPVSSSQIEAVLVRLESSAARLNASETLDALRKINGWGNESERNRVCIVSAGAVSALAVAFDGFAAGESVESVVVLEELLASMSWMFPIADAEALRRLGSTDSVKALVNFLKPNSNRRLAGDVSAKHNALSALKELLLSPSSCSNRETMMEIEGLDEILFQFLKSPISPSITKSTLTLIFNLLQISTTKTEQFKSSLISSGTVDLLLAITIDYSTSSKSISEKALGVLDKLCDSAEGRAAASRNSLTVPLLVKKILRISAAATGFSVSVIWKLGRCEQKALVEGLQVGAFQKLVLVLQLGCGDETKEKATTVLKLMNPYRNEFECTESVDFKNLKRSF